MYTVIHLRNIFDLCVTPSAVGPLFMYKCFIKSVYTHTFISTCMRVEVRVCAPHTPAQAATQPRANTSGQTWWLLGVSSGCRSETTDASPGASPSPGSPHPTHLWRGLTDCLFLKIFSLNSRS